MRKSILLALAGLALLAGCKDSGNNTSGIPVAPKWKGAAYHLAFDTQPAKPGDLLPAIKYTANPDAVERRAVLLVKFDSSAVKQQPVMDQIIMPPNDIVGTEGTLAPEYVASAGKELTNLLKAYCMNGKIKVSVMLARSSLNSHAGDSEIDSKRLSDWLPTEILFKNPHKGC